MTVRASKSRGIFLIGGVLSANEKDEVNGGSVCFDRRLKINFS